MRLNFAAERRDAHMVFRADETRHIKIVSFSLVISAKLQTVRLAILAVACCVAPEKMNMNDGLRG